jgi:hypothetical protein
VKIIVMPSFSSLAWSMGKIMNLKKLSLMLCLCLLPLAGAGCSTDLLGVMLANGDNEQDVDAEYTGLDNHTVAIVIFADPGVLFYYPYARNELSLLIASQMQKNLKGVRILDPSRVIGYQNDTLDWEAQDKTQLGKKFGVDYVLYISLTTFETKEMGMEYLFRGDIQADVAIYDAAKDERQANVWSATGLHVVHPKQAIPAENDLAVRRETESKFADELVKKFYRHKTPQE